MFDYVRNMFGMNVLDVHFSSGMYLNNGWINSGRGCHTKNRYRSPWNPRGSGVAGSNSSDLLQFRSMILLSVLFIRRNFCSGWQLDINQYAGTARTYVISTSGHLTMGRPMNFNISFNSTCSINAKKKQMQAKLPTSHICTQDSTVETHST